MEDTVPFWINILDKLSPAFRPVRDPKLPSVGAIITKKCNLVAKDDEIIRLGVVCTGIDVFNQHGAARSAIGPKQFLPRRARNTGEIDVGAEDDGFRGCDTVAGVT